MRNAMRIRFESGIWRLSHYRDWGGTHLEVDRDLTGWKSADDVIGARVDFDPCQKHVRRRLNRRLHRRLAKMGS